MSAVRLTVPQLRLLARLAQGWHVHHGATEVSRWEAVGPGGVREAVFDATVARLLRGTQDHGPLVYVHTRGAGHRARLALTAWGCQVVGLYPLGEKAREGAR